MFRPSLRFDRLSAIRVLAAAALLAAAAWHVRAEPPMPTRVLKVGTHPLKVEVAQTEAQRSQGLMFRKALGRDDGMLFIFDDPGYYAMWMKNTLIPLSVAFVDANGVILNVADMEPQTLDSHPAQGPAVYAIETNKGWFAEHRVGAGDKVAGLPKP
ncbi:MAG TPA: DUF192 domain-containing protein [Usitatibacter sp.]|jgi:hypothetical protein|nr:DUF192 domain-containing protein [Usitatibacter sp.]